MLDKFNIESRYKFSKELFIEDYNKYNESDVSIHFGWVNKIDGGIVRVLGEDGGIVGSYNVVPEWCVEIIEGDDN